MEISQLLAEVRNHNEDPISNCNLGDVCHELVRATGAFTEYEAVLKIDPAFSSPQQLKQSLIPVK